MPILLDFRYPEDRKRFNADYSPEVFSALRHHCSFEEPNETLQVQMPPSQHDPLYAADEEIPRRFSIWIRSHRLETSNIWVYYFDRFT